MAHDLILWNGKNDFSYCMLKDHLFSLHLVVDWSKEIFLKGFALNYSLYYWLAILGGLKTSNKLSAQGIGANTYCILCKSS